MTLTAKIFLEQILPLGIIAIDQLLFLLARTAFDLFLAGNGYGNVIAAFEKYQLRDIVLLCEGGFSLTVIHDTALQVVGDTSVEHSVMSIGHDVNAVLSFAHVVLLSVVSLRALWAK
jgi:hypothetical protein